jgi:hypothetical protein
MDTALYQAFTDQLTANLQADPRVIGLVLLGSTANQSHPPDEWSDHDFFIITESGLQEAFRTNLAWLPNHESIVLSVRETAHGLKIVYGDGHVLEFAVFDIAEISLAKANDYTVVFDRGGVYEAMTKIAVPAGQPVTYSLSDQQRDMGLFLSLLVIGAGRVARGEVISGQAFIRMKTLDYLLPLVANHHPADDKSVLDNLDPLRRFEKVFPGIGAEINTALDREPIGAAAGLLDIFERILGNVEGYPSEGVATVRVVLKRAANE